MNDLKLSAALFFSFILASCVHSEPHYAKSEVLERIGNATETPEWASGATAMTSEGSKALFISVITMNGDARPEACMRAASDTARADILRYIRDALSTSGQLNDTSVTSDPSYESLTAFLAQEHLSGVSVESRYWEKVVSSDTSANRVLKLRCAAKVGISKVDLARQLQAAVGPGGNSVVRQKLLDAQQKFIDQIGEGQLTH